MREEDIKSRLPKIQQNSINVSLLMQVNTITSHKGEYLDEIRRLSQLSFEDRNRKMMDKSYDMLRYYRLVNGKRIRRRFD